MSQEEIDKALPVDAFDSAGEALDALVNAMRSGVKATIKTIEIGVEAISSGRWGELTAADNERLGRLKVLLESLKSSTTHSNN